MAGRSIFDPLVPAGAYDSFVDENQTDDMEDHGDED